MNGWRRGVRSNKTCAAIFVTAFFAATLFATPRSSAAEIQTAAWMPGGELRHEAALPHVLATADAERYRLIFLLEGSGQWEAADREINGLKDRLLLGHVLALRYLHPRYRVTYDELAHWLDSYADQPDAKAIYALAQKRAPTAAAEPVKPVAGTLVPQSMEEDFGPRPLSRAEGGNGGEPDAHWQKGLAAWREGRFDEAATHFEALAKTPGQSPWTVSAGAFWAARAELKNRRPEHVAYWLGIAAERPHTFYGLIARKLLGVDALFNFDGESFTVEIEEGIDAQQLARDQPVECMRPLGGDAEPVGDMFGTAVLELGAGRPEGARRNRPGRLSGRLRQRLEMRRRLVEPTFAPGGEALLPMRVRLASIAAFGAAQWPRPEILFHALGHEGAGNRLDRLGRRGGGALLRQGINRLGVRLVGIGIEPMRQLAIRDAIAGVQVA